MSKRDYEAILQLLEENNAEIVDKFNLRKVLNKKQLCISTIY